MPPSTGSFLSGYPSTHSPTWKCPNWPTSFWKTMFLWRKGTWPSILICERVSLSKCCCACMLARLDACMHAWMCCVCVVCLPVCACGFLCVCVCVCVCAGLLFTSCSMDRFWHEFSGLPTNKWSTPQPGSTRKFGYAYFK